MVLIVVDRSSRSQRRAHPLAAAIVTALGRNTRIAFRGDDARRRAWVIGSGLDVWEILQAIADNRRSLEDLLSRYSFVAINEQ